METHTFPTSAQDQDKKTQAQIDAISQQIRESQPLASHLQPISTLLQQYKSSSSQSESHSDISSKPQDSNFVKGCQYLATKYKSWRRIRGDGNCYYRAFLYSLCEQLLEGSLAKDPNILLELDRLICYAKNSLDEVTKFGYDRFTIEMFQEEFVELLEFLLCPSNAHENISNSSQSSTLLLAQQDLHAKLNAENSSSDYCTWYLRVITAAYLKKHPDRFVHFLDEQYYDVPTFCSREVEPMGKECTNVSVLSLAEALGITVNIEYLDGQELQTIREKQQNQNQTKQQTSAEGKIHSNNHDAHCKKGLVRYKFGPNHANEQNCVQLTLLYRPGHYDVLYST